MFQIKQKNLPPHSFINTADFNSTDDLANYLNKVANDKDVRDPYFWYKKNESIRSALTYDHPSLEEKFQIDEHEFDTYQQNEIIDDTISPLHFTDQNGETECKSTEDSDESKIHIHDGNLNATNLIAITGSYLGKNPKLNSIKTVKAPNNDKKKLISPIHQSAEHISAFNKLLSKKHSKLIKSNKQQTKSANIWDRQYSAFCIAKDIPNSFVQKYAKNYDKNDEKESEKRCNLLVKCGGIYAMNTTKTSAFCDGFILNDDCSKPLIKLPSLNTPRSNCSAIYDDKAFGFIVYGGRSHKKSLLNDFEVLSVQKNEQNGWKKNVIPPTKEYRSRHPSIGIFDDSLFVCGGRNVAALNSAEFLKLNDEESKWQSIGNMNYSRSFASNLIEWKENKSIVILGGYGSFFAEFYAERFDLSKNQWYEFPKCHYSHKYWPCIKLSEDHSDGHQQLLMVICNKRTKGNLGQIEILDIRMKKWMKCKISTDDWLQLDKKQELRRLLFC